MLIIWILIGFIICLFMPAPIQMSVKNFISRTYESIKEKLSRDE